MSKKTETKKSEKSVEKNVARKSADNNTVQQYHIVLVKPYIKDGEKRFGYTRIGIAFRKNGGDMIDLKLDLFPVITQGAFIQLRPAGALKRKAA